MFGLGGEISVALFNIFTQSISFLVQSLKLNLDLIVVLREFDSLEVKQKV